MLKLFIKPKIPTRAHNLALKWEPAAKFAKGYAFNIQLILCDWVRLHIARRSLGALHTIIVIHTPVTLKNQRQNQSRRLTFNWAGSKVALSASFLLLGKSLELGLLGHCCHL